jgi:hypothetical protein
MGDRVTDEVLAAFAVVARPEELAPRLVERCAGAVDRLALTAPLGGEQLADLLRALRGGTRKRSEGA